MASRTRVQMASRTRVAWSRVAPLEFEGISHAHCAAWLCRQRWDTAGALVSAQWAPVPGSNRQTHSSDRRPLAGRVSWADTAGASATPFLVAKLLIGVLSAGAVPSAAKRSAFGRTPVAYGCRVHLSCTAEPNMICTVTCQTQAKTKIIARSPHACGGGRTRKRFNVTRASDRPGPGVRRRG